MYDMASRIWLADIYTYHHHLKLMILQNVHLHVNFANDSSGHFLICLETLKQAVENFLKIPNKQTFWTI